jgi:hypothetical protein
MGGHALADGHETMSTSLLDARPQAIVDMPHATPWPFVLTVAMMLTFYGVLLDHYMMAGVGAAGSVAGLLGWFWPRGETQET